jgi:hypothetical protein
MARFIAPIAFGLCLMLCVGCGSSNHLAEYTYRDHSIATIASVPNHARVRTEGWVWVDPDHPFRSLFRVAGRIVKEAEADRLAARLDSAALCVDLGQLVVDETLLGTARVLQAVPVDDESGADYLLDIYVKEYGLDAGSWTSAVYFKLDAEVALLDRDGRRIWHTKIHEREPTGPEIWGLGPGLNDLITAGRLSGLSVDELARGLENLSDFSADHIVRRLRRDLYRARD